MRQRSVRMNFVRSLCILMVSYPLLFPILCAVGLGFDGNQLLELMLKPTHFLVVMLGFLAAWGVFEEKRWANSALGCYLAAVAGESLAIASQLTQSSSEMRVVLLLILAIVLLAFILTVRRIRKEQRRSIHLTSQIMDSSGHPLMQGQILNLSRGGGQFEVLPQGPYDGTLLVKARYLQIAEEKELLAISVVDTMGSKLALRFDRLSAVQEQVIERLLSADELSPAKSHRP